MLSVILVKTILQSVHRYVRTLSMAFTAVMHLMQHGVAHITSTMTKVPRLFGIYLLPTLSLNINGIIAISTIQIRLSISTLRSLRHVITASALRLHARVQRQACIHSGSLAAHSKNMKTVICASNRMFTVAMAIIRECSVQVFKQTL